MALIMRARITMEGKPNKMAGKIMLEAWALPL
jgi:hypothetical protein